MRIMLRDQAIFISLVIVYIAALLYVNSNVKLLWGRSWNDGEVQDAL